MATFGEAIEALKAGDWAARDGWNGKGMHIYLEDAWTETVKGGVFKGQKVMHDAHICMFTAHKTHQHGWLASQADMLATDWQIIEPHN
jgi:hypothetical protein